MPSPDSITGNLLQMLAQPQRAAAFAEPLADKQQALQALLEYHRIAPWLYRHLNGVGTFVDCPEAVRNIVEQQRLKEMARGLGRHRDLCRVAQALHEAQVQAWILKGGHLAYRYYADPLLRPMSDLDILIAEADFDRAFAALGAMGYELVAMRDEHASSHNMANLKHPSAFHIDLHKHFESPGFGTTIDLDSVLSRSLPHPLIPSLRVFSPEDQLLHCCLHASLHHGWRISLVGLVDIQKIILQEPALDWMAIVERARQWRALPHLAAALAVVCGRLATPWPPQARRLLENALPSAANLERIVQILCFDFADRSPSADRVLDRIGNLQGDMSKRERAKRVVARMTGLVDRSGRPTQMHGLTRLRQALLTWINAFRGGLLLLSVAHSRERRRALKALADYEAERREWQRSADPFAQSKAELRR